MMISDEYTKLSKFAREHLILLLNIVNIAYSLVWQKKQQKKENVRNVVKNFWDEGIRSFVRIIVGILTTIE
jgi:hypothetical protein